MSTDNRLGISGPVRFRDRYDMQHHLTTCSAMLMEWLPLEVMSSQVRVIRLAMSIDVMYRVCTNNTIAPIFSYFVLQNWIMPNSSTFLSYFPSTFKQKSVHLYTNSDPSPSWSNQHRRRRRCYPMARGC